MFTITHTSGAMEQGQLRSLPNLLDELLDADGEHPDVAVSHESGWTLGLYGSGRLVLEHLEDDIEPVHCFATRDDQLIAATAVALGNASELRNWPWLPGYG
jgi:hypothetical protein